MPPKIIIKNADFLVGSKYEKLCKFTRNVVYKISENPHFFYFFFIILVKMSGLVLICLFRIISGVVFICLFRMPELVLITVFQFGSVSFRTGSGSGSSDPFRGITDPESDQT